MNNWKVSAIRLHKTMFIPGLGSMNQTVIDQRFYPGIAMEIHEAGVLCKHKGVSFILPFVDAECIVLADNYDQAF